MSAHEKTLESLLDTVKKTVKTDAYPMSIGELHSMYERGELILKPVYQRFFRWTPGQKTKLIESILIGLPLPSFFVASDEDGNWEVVDGMQRLSTIFEFMGVLKGENPGEVKTPLRLSTESEDMEELIYLPDFSGKGWEDLGIRIQRDFRRTKVQLTILLRSDTPESKFDLFQRLNSNGTQISAQELRNAMMAEGAPKMLDWMDGLAKNKHFLDVTSLSEKKREERFDMELVLRFIVCCSEYLDDLKKFDGIEVFLTSSLRKMVKKNDFDFDKFSFKFNSTFECINRVKGAKALCFRGGPGSGRFSITAFETIALGIAQNLDNLPEDAVISKKIDELGSQPEFKEAGSRAGSHARSRLPSLLEFGKKYFSA